MVNCLSSSRFALACACLAAAALCSAGCGSSSGGDCGTCDTNAICNKDVKPAACVCSDGYAGNGKTCAPVTCPALTIANGSVTPTGEATFKTAASYSCDNGYSLSGEAKRTCQADQTWTGTAPTCEKIVNGCDANPCVHGPCTATGTSGGYSCGPCETGYTGANCDQPISCPALTDPQNGSVTPTSTVFGGTATYGCHAGYTLAGDATRTCQADGTWSGAAPTCTPNACAPDLIAPTNGTVSLTTGVTGEVATYGCNQGWALSGNTTRLCQADGTWSGTDPTCALVVSACDPNPCLHAGTCALSGASGFSCGCVDGWTGTTCDVAVTCSGATAPDHGTVSAASAAYNASVTYGCDAGYTLAGSSTRLCQANGSFAGSAPTCTANACAPDLTAPTNGTVNRTHGVTGEVATFGCNGGYSLSGNSTRTCQPDGTWSGSAPVCSAVTTGCVPNPCVHSPGCTPVAPSGYSCGTCDTGWTGANCDAPVTCSGAAAPAHGSVSATSVTYNLSVTYSCDNGYTLSGSATRTCQNNGTFSGTAPTCAPVDCGAAPTVVNAGAPTVSGGAGGGATTTFGATAAYACTTGYAKTGADATCGAVGSWSLAPSCNPINCGAAPTVQNAGAPTVSGGNGGTNSTTYGATAAYACNAGYNKNGADPKCALDASWGTPPTCVPVDCGTPPTVANAGTPVVSGGAGGGASDTYGATAAYTCNNNFSKNGTDPVCAATGQWGTAPKCVASVCGTFTDVVYRLTGTFAITNTFAGMGNQSFANQSLNASTPPFVGTGNTTQFSRPPPTPGTTFTAGFARLRYVNDAAGNPQAGTVNLVEWYLPLEFHQTAGATLDVNTDHSVGLLLNPASLANCEGSGTAKCTSHAPTLQRNCTANAQGTLSGTTLAWASCTPNPPMANGWSYDDARATTGAGCVTSYNSWGTVACVSGCGNVPDAGKGDSYQTWNQQLKSFTFSGTNIKTATFTMSAMQIPNDSTGTLTSATTSLSITSTSVIGSQCGSTPGTDLVCNIQ